MPRATASAGGLWAFTRKAFIMSPVLIPTGQARAHVPSPAQVSTALYEYSRMSSRDTGESTGWRTISRRRAIRWRGVVVTRRLGHTCSQ